MGREKQEQTIRDFIVKAEIPDDKVITVNSRAIGKLGLGPIYRGKSSGIAKAILRDLEDGAKEGRNIDYYEIHWETITGHSYRHLDADQIDFI